ncbi:MAG TPA: DUF4136 domain-containing protein [Steroidobacteraceae bacterium]|nr:DUF4136 domain-containing protein [Steroidobacteraceae bacterium]
MLVSAVAALVCSACASQKSAVRVDQAETPKLCNTFAWHEPSKDPASLMAQRIQRTAMATMRNKGYQTESGAADCKLSYAYSSYELAKPKPSVGVGAVGGSGGVGGGIGISLPLGRHPTQHATLTLDVIDSATNSQVWSGTLEADLDKADPSDQELQKMIETILARYPDRASK